MPGNILGTRNSSLRLSRDVFFTLKTLNIVLNWQQQAINKQTKLERGQVLYLRMKQWQKKGNRNNMQYLRQPAMRDSKNDFNVGRANQVLVFPDKFLYLGRSKLALQSAPLYTHFKLVKRRPKIACQVALRTTCVLSFLPRSPYFCSLESL